MGNVLSRRFYQVLLVASMDRDKRAEEVRDSDGNKVPAWAIHERSLLLTEVNLEREAKGLQPVGAEDIKKGESVGHPEYGRVLADHCACLASG